MLGLLSRQSLRPKAPSLKTSGKDNDPMNESTRFEEAFSVASEDQYDQLAKGYVPKRHWKMYYSWAINNFSDWCCHVIFGPLKYLDPPCRP